MQISLHKKSDVEATISVKVEEADYQSEVAKKLKEHSKTAQVKGFRPGNVPLEVIKRLHGPSIIAEKVGTLVEEALQKYIKEKKLSMLGGPVPKMEEAPDWNEQREFSFHYDIGMAGPFTYNLSKDIKVTGYVVNSISEQTIDSFVENLRLSHGELECVDQAEKEDEICGTLHCAAHDFKTYVVIHPNKLHVRAQQHFVGIEPKQTITFNIKDVFDSNSLGYFSHELYKKMVETDEELEFTVDEIHRKVLADLDQELFDEVFKRDRVTTEEEFRQAIKKRLLKLRKQEAEWNLNWRIEDALLQQAAIALPDDFLKQLLPRQLDISREKVEESYAHHARRIRWLLLTEKLRADFDTLDVTPDDVMAYVKSSIKEYFAEKEKALTEEDAAAMANSFIRENKTGSELYQTLYEQVRSQKLVDFIKDKITIDLQEISVEEFDKIVAEIS